MKNHIVGFIFKQDREDKLKKNLDSRRAEMTEKQKSNLLIGLLTVLVLAAPLLFLNKETSVYDIESSVSYQSHEESGVFTTKKKTREYVDVIFIAEEGIKKINTQRYLVKIGDKSKVVYKKWNVGRDVYLTVEDYHKLFEEDAE